MGEKVLVRDIVSRKLKLSQKNSGKLVRALGLRERD